MFVHNLFAKFHKSLAVLILPLVLAASVRFYSLHTLPSGLHWDEQDTGYQALNLLHTGRDYQGNPLPLFLHSLADYRTPVFIYANVVSMAIFGNSAFGVRFLSAMLGSLSVVVLYIAAYRVFNNRKLALFAAFLLAVNPWHVQYSRQAVETLTMVTVVLLGFAKLWDVKKTVLSGLVSGLLFGLATASYSTAKLFVPLFLVFMLVAWFVAKRINFLFILAILISFNLIFLPILFDGIFGKSGLRFSHLSVFTDPTTQTELNWQLQEVGRAVHGPDAVGISPSKLDRLVYNKYTRWLTKIGANYLQTFSSQYLFLVGDPETRHSPSKNSIGMLLGFEFITILAGIIVLNRLAQAKYIYAWLILAPLPAALTRDGGTHAARLLILLPALIIVSALGLFWLVKQIKVLGYLAFGILGFCFISYALYFFTVYRWESAPSFTYGYDTASQIAFNNKTNYDQIIIDGANDPVLMAYLFHINHKSADYAFLSHVRIFGQEANQIDNVFLMRPGERNWSELIKPDNASKKSLFILSNKLKPLGTPKQTITYPDGSVALNIFESGAR